MNLTELKKKPIGELIKIAEFMGLEGMARNRKQDIILPFETPCDEWRRNFW